MLRNVSVSLQPTATPLFDLLPSKMDPILKSNELENELRVLVIDYRQVSYLLVRGFCFPFSALVDW